MRFHDVSIQPHIMGVCMHMNYMSPRRLKQWWVGGCAHYKNFVFAPPSFLVSLPYANTGIQSEGVKHE